MTHTPSTYALLKASGLCVQCAKTAPVPGYVRCTPCLEASCTHHDAGSAAVRAIVRGMRGFPPAPRETTHLVGHCGGWWPVHAVPLCLPCCGTLLFLEMEAP